MAMTVSRDGSRLVRLIMASLGSVRQSPPGILPDEFSNFVSASSLGFRL
jgi:hypothetical protein